MYESNMQNPAGKIMREMLASALYLAGAVSYSVYALFYFFGSIAGETGFSSIVSRVFEQGDDFYYIQTFIDGASMIGALIGAVPVLVITAGIWILFAASRTGDRPGLENTGFTMLRVIVIIQLVCVSLTAVTAVISCIFVMVETNAALENIGLRFSPGYFLGLIIGTVAFLVIRIIYYVKLERSIRRAGETASGAGEDFQTSKYVEIFWYVLGGINALSALIALAGLSLYSFLEQAGLASAYIIFAILQTKYRGRPETLAQSSYQEPSYQEPARQPYQEPARQPYQEPAHQEPARQPYQEPSHQEPVYPESSASSNETVVLPYYNETAVLSGQLMQGNGEKLIRMTRQRGGETFCISKPSFWIGKDPANVDYCITNNRAVSRRHVLVTIQNGRCCIRDNHSTNRTYVNGQAVSPDMDVVINDGDRLKLGDEEFIVSIG